jgi:uncharacterized protein (DUF924 family)
MAGDGMAGDLESGRGEVQPAAQAVIAFWFIEVPADKRFAKDAALDSLIAERFGALRDDVLASGAAGWRGDPQTVLAAILLLDQFSRNMHRGSAEAYRGDALALRLTQDAITAGWDDRLEAEQRLFLYLPLMHAEDRETQAVSIACFERLGDAEALAYARDHADVIARFGRFPSRNAALGRASTPAEIAYLSQPGAGW